MHDNRKKYSFEEYQDIIIDRWQHTLLWLGKYSAAGDPELWFARPTPSTPWCPGKPRAKYYKKIYARLATQLNIQSKNYTFCTLTYHTEKYSPEGAAALLPSHIKEFMRLLRKKLGKLQYFWIIELTSLGYPHLHIIFDRYIHWRVIRAIWYKVTKCKVTDIRKIPAGNLAAYVTKYITKQSKQNEDKFGFIFKNIDRMWSSSRGFFTKGDPREKVFILVGFSSNLYYLDKFICRNDPEEEVWLVPYDFAVPLLHFDTFISRSIRSDASQFVEEMRNLFPYPLVRNAADILDSFYHTPVY